MRRRDSDQLEVRALYRVLRLSLRLRTVARTLRTLNWLTVASVVVLTLALVMRSWIWFADLGVLLIANVGQWMYFRYYLERAGLDEVDEMTGWEFEHWLARFFDRLGFDVETTPYTGDYGADLILTWCGIRTAVQAKRTSRSVGVRAVQEVVAARAFYDCERAMVVTNGHFTAEAVNLARSNHVRMRSRDDLARELASMGVTAALVSGDLVSAE